MLHGNQKASPALIANNKHFFNFYKIISDTGLLPNLRNQQINILFRFIHQTHSTTNTETQITKQKRLKKCPRKINVG